MASRIFNKTIAKPPCPVYNIAKNPKGYKKGLHTMEILIYLFIIGVMLILLFYVGSILLTPILIAGGTIGILLAGIFKIICSFFSLFGWGLGKMSEIETGKTKSQQIKDLKNKKSESVQDAKWKEVVGDDTEFGTNINIEENTNDPSNPSDIFNDIEDTPQSKPEVRPELTPDGKLPAGFFDGV